MTPEESQVYRRQLRSAVRTPEESPVLELDAMMCGISKRSLLRSARPTPSHFYRRDTPALKRMPMYIQTNNVLPAWQADGEVEGPERLV